MEDKRMNEETLKKKVDETYKTSVEKDKGPKPETEFHDLEVTFGLFISGLMMEGLIALGIMEHPVTKKKEPNALHAKYIIDTLSMIKDKTANNLTKEEQESIEAILYELRMRFVAGSKGK